MSEVTKRLYLQGYIHIRSIKHYKRVMASLYDIGYNHTSDASTDELDARRGFERGNYTAVWFNDAGKMMVLTSYSVVKYSLKFKRKELLKATHRLYCKSCKGCQCHLTKGTK